MVPRFLLILLLGCTCTSGSVIDSGIVDSLKGNIKWENIRDNLRNFTEEMHLAGTPGAERLALKIADKWRTAGLTDVHFVEYEVLLSYPDFSEPNTMSILSASNTSTYRSSGKSRVLLSEEQNSVGADIQWVAYSGNGTVVGDIVYCNYGRNVDFEVLKENGIELNGKIAFIRYGEGYRGNKVRKAQKLGAIGVILYSDPADCASEGTEEGDVYPSKKWMPSEGVQRGSVRALKGDPLTPRQPAKTGLLDFATIEEAKDNLEIPSIPVMPLSYSDAWHILTRMDGQEAPPEWQGGLNVTYRFGPGLRNGEKVQIDVKSSLQKRTIRNVIGYIEGAEEPDKYVMLGNHFDAWVYGSVDPNSGTAVLAEVARALVQTAEEKKWRPKRTIMFCNWDAEEFGLIGSTEFVEEFANILRDRAVIYLNVDNIHANETMYVATIPSLYETAYKTAKLVENPMLSEIAAGRATVYDTWVEASPSSYSYLSDAPTMPFPRGNSDHAPFLNFLGLPVAHISYSNRHSYGYPLYHTMYETPFLNEHVFDTNNLSVHRAVGQYLALMAYQFADLPTIPLNVNLLARAIAEDHVPALKADLNGSSVDVLIQVEHLEEDVQMLHSTLTNLTWHLR
uniref:Peptidase_M28 domain-containing protein n=1 Tax=Steinernema glaseri TaxID=37863 RepID=A0A1I7ZYF3_9BILA